MGEIADSLINGEFDLITGEYIGEAVGFPRMRSYGKRNAPPIIKKPSSKANVCITNMCKDRGFDSRKKTELVSKFLQNKGYEQLPKLSRQYKIIYNEYKSEFKAFLNELTKKRQMIMNSINKNGCSVCQLGKENYTTYTTKLRGKRVRMFQYDYRTESGKLFSCCSPTLEACREKRDKWLQNYV